MCIQNLNRCVFTGDTLFVAGCGKFFEGNAKDMLKSMDEFLKLPIDTKIFCGHEYTLSNFEFCMKVEGETNPNIPEFKKVYEGQLKAGAYSVPAILNNEKHYNVFLRCRTPEL